MARLEVLRAPTAGLDQPRGPDQPAVVARLVASALACGIPVGAWNILRLVLRPTAAAPGNETLDVFLNPVAHAASPTLGRVAPRLRVTAAVAGGGAGRRAVTVAPPAPGEGYVMWDYISALPVDGGIRKEDRSSDIQ
jgi:hypothetical protein